VGVIVALDLDIDVPARAGSWTATQQDARSPKGKKTRGTKVGSLSNLADPIRVEAELWFDQNHPNKRPALKQGSRQEQNGRGREAASKLAADKLDCRQQNGDQRETRC
jgi:hypothetical protein